MKLSFCLITLNEEQNLPRCLRSCAELAGTGIKSGPTFCD